MNNGVVIWLIIFALAAVLFFVIAVVVSIKGFADLLTLLRHSGTRDKHRTKPEQEVEGFLDGH